MAERGNKWNRAVDRYAGIPLTVFGAAFRKCGRLFRKPAGKVSGIAVICLGAIGDLLLVSGLVNGLRKKFPTAEITLITTVANSVAAPLLGGVNRVKSYPLSKIVSLVTDLRRSQYDLLIDTTQWARIGSLVCAFSKASVTIGFRTKGEARALPYDISVEHIKSRHEWVNFLELARAVYPDISGAPFLAVPETLSKNAETLLPDTKFILCHMWAQGSHGAEKEWVPSKWAELAVYLLDKGYGVIFSGSEADESKTDEFLNDFSLFNFPRVLNIAGKLTLTELARYMQRAETVVAVNTGIMHLAALSGVCTIGLHGPSNPLRWGPVGRCTYAVTHRGVTEFPDMEFHRACSTTSFTRHVEVAEVIEALEKLINCPSS